LVVMNTMLAPLVTKPLRILFVCPPHVCWSPMAVGFVLARRRKDVVAECGLCPNRINPVVIKVMAEVGIDISGLQCHGPQDLGTAPCDLVIALSSGAVAEHALLPGLPEIVNWNLRDPSSVEGDQETVLNAFRTIRDTLRRLVDDFFERGYFTAFAQARKCGQLILNNISDGIIVHDLERRVLCFNEAAVRITGYHREEVLGQDCHSVFPGGLCGSKCLFPENGCVPTFEIKNQEVTLATKSGETRHIRACVRALCEPDGKPVGVLASFRDVTREQHLARRVGDIEQFSGIVGRDPKMLEVFDLIRELAEANVPVLIQGESGTGKELVAAAIHNEGPRAHKLFVPVNCGALPESLLESELFGHVKGAFTGAIRDKKGRFELADGGTIFLDEIGDLSPAMQVKLLRVLQEGKFERVGSEKTIQVDVRVISATNKNIAEEIAKGRFREDLFYRLSVVPIFLPPLRERRNDIPLLVKHLLQRILEAAGRPPVTVSPEALDIMMSYDWPGNVRELQNWLQFALVKCRGEIIRPEHLPPRARGLKADARTTHSRRKLLDIQVVKDALAQTNGNRMEAAKRLGVSRATLYRFLDKFGTAW